MEGRLVTVHLNIVRPRNGKTSNSTSLVLPSSTLLSIHPPICPSMYPSIYSSSHISIQSTPKEVSYTAPPERGSVLPCWSSYSMKGPKQPNERLQRDVMGVVTGVTVIQSKGSTCPNLRNRRLRVTGTLFAASCRHLLLNCHSQRQGMLYLLLILNRDS